MFTADFFCREHSMIILINKPYKNSRMEINYEEENYDVSFGSNNDVI